MASVGLTAPIVDGQIATTQTADNTSKDTTGTGELGKEAFLQLLVAQMKYQDPLNPTSDTEYVSQLATFSSLEEMQNLNSTMNNTQAYSLVGKYVMIKTETSTGESSVTGGKVDYVFVENGDAYLNINGNDYPMENLDSVVNEEYVKGLASKGDDTTNDLATASQLIGKNITIMDSTEEGKLHTGDVTKAYMDNGHVYVEIDSESYLYDNLVSVNQVEEEEKPDYLELLTKDVSELKELLLKAAEEKAANNAAEDGITEPEQLPEEETGVTDEENKEQVNED